MLNELKVRNTLLCINTGRSYHHLHEDMALHNIEADFYITSSGGEIHDKSGKIIHVEAMEPSVVEAVLEVIFSNKTHTFSVGMKENPIHAFKKDCDVWDMSLVKKIDESVYTVSTKLATEEEALEFKKELESRVNVSAHVNRISVDITAKGVSKKTGIEILSQYLNIPHTSITVIGDSLNDVPMIEAYGGYTVHNALDSVKAIAKGSFADVGEMIEKIML